jgi:hypothetical protein
MNLTTHHRNLIAFCVAGLLGSGAFAAMAQTAAAPVQAQNDAVAQQTPAVGAALPGDAPAQDAAAKAGAQEVASAGAEKKLIDRKCLQYTGSRIRAYDPRTGKRPCMAGPGSSYSRDDLDSTGQVDLAKALRQIDPAISGH